MTGIWWDMSVQLWSIHVVSHILEPRFEQHGKAWPPAKCPKAWKAQRFIKIWLKKKRRCLKKTRFGLDRWHRLSMQGRIQGFSTRTVRQIPDLCPAYAVRHAYAMLSNFSNGVTLLCDLNFKQFELGTEAVEQAAPGTHCLNRTELWSQFSFTKQNCVYLFLKCFFVKEWFWFFFALRW